jgi:hypothetical protein
MFHIRLVSKQIMVDRVGIAGDHSGSPDYRTDAALQKPTAHAKASCSSFAFYLYYTI